jgi:hypothetical protein
MKLIRAPGRSASRARTSRSSAFWSRSRPDAGPHSSTSVALRASPMPLLPGSPRSSALPIMVKVCFSSGRSCSRARASSATRAVSSIGVPGGSSTLRLLRPRSVNGMKVVGMNGTSASEATNSASAVHSVRPRWRSETSTQPR